MALNITISGQTNTDGSATLRASVSGRANERLALYNEIAQSTSQVTLDTAGKTVVPLGKARGGCFRFTFRGEYEERTETVLMDGPQPVSASRKVPSSQVGLLDKVIAGVTTARIHKAFESWDLVKFTRDNVVAIGATGTLGVACAGFQPSCGFAVAAGRDMLGKLLADYLKELVDVLHRDGVITNQERGIVLNTLLVIGLVPAFASLARWNHLSKDERTKRVMELFGELLDATMERVVRDTQYEAHYTLFRDQFQKTYVLVQFEKLL
jgi:hypothetical protein